jgi:glycosyltransferase involved in cell wall biosynthesis
MSLRIVIVNPFEALPWEVKRPHRYNTLSAELVRRGHQVVWLTADFRHRTKRYRKSPLSNNNTTVEVRLIHVPSYSQNISLRRLISHRFYAHGVSKTLRVLQSLGSIDVVVASLPPIGSARYAMEFCAGTGAVGLVDVLDAWPQALEVVFPQPVRRHLSALLLEFLRREVGIAADLASGLIGVSPEYLGYISGFRKTEVDIPQSVLLLGFDIEGVQLPETKKLNDPNKPLTAVYMGTFGRFYDLETIVRAAHVCADRGIRFICIGDGPTHERVTQLARELQLDNVDFMGFVPDEAAYSILLNSDVGLVTYTADYPPSIPTKPFNYLFCGLAVVSSLKGSFEQILHHEQFGLQYEAGNTESLANALIYMDKHRDLLHNMGVKGMEYARKHMDGRSIYSQYADFIEELVMERRPEPGSPLSGRA